MDGGRSAARETGAKRASGERRGIMKTQAQKTVPLGELVRIVFDKAAQYSLDPKEVASLATKTVARMLCRGRNFTPSQPSLAQ
jgi:hypothetical protein